VTKSSGAFNKELSPRGDPDGARIALRLLLVLVLIAAVVVEGYYIFVLQDKIERQSEQLRTISIQLQSSKSESTDLHEELSSMKKMAGEGKDGNTANGQH
jgi:Tfp pilus assembly protein PilO